MAEFKDEDFLFGASNEKESEELAFLNKESKNQDGIYRPRLEDAADPRGSGYRAIIRFLRNVYRDGSGTGPAAIQKHVHYADFKNYPELSGYYDCEKNASKQTPCPLCTTYWKLNKSNNNADVENSKLIKRSTKYYSYVMIIEDEQHPELVGKILIYPYGAKIKEKINAELNGDVSEDGSKCNVFDFVTGKDFRLVIKIKKTPPLDGRPGAPIDMPNYDTSIFLPSSPLKIFSEKSQKFVTPPVEIIDGKPAITDKKWQAKIKEVLMNRPENVNIEDHMPKALTDEQRENIDKIVSILTGNEVFKAEHTAKTSASKAPVNIVDDDIDSIFEFDDDTDDDI